MSFIFEELFAGLPDWREIERVSIRLLAASVLGAVIGWQREHFGKSAGLRTHMLVSLGAALFVLAPIQLGMNSDALSRVIQGLTAGMGFIGAGAIIKGRDEAHVQGLTTAAGIWLTAALGVAAGLGALGVALVALILAWIILAVLVHFEPEINKSQKAKPPQREA
jgi:putative Mg2+ transporter-C (MgtC) family protein